jgi:hypothetical protein
MHVLPLQQPFGHRLASHSFMQPCSKQCCDGLQVTQAVPPSPHWASVVPDSQLVPLQQPPGHQYASHDATHCLFVQSWPSPQLAQAEPLLPHWT